MYNSFKDAIRLKKSEKIIAYVNGLCGSGKTYSAIKTIQDHRSTASKRPYYEQGKWIIATPSCELSQQIYDDFPDNLKENVHLVNGRVVKNSKVMSKLREVLEKNNNVDNCNHDVIIIQQQLLPYLSQSFPHIHKYNLIIDEIPQIDKYFAIALKINGSFITDHVEVDDEFNGLYKLRFKAGHKTKIKRILKEKTDDVFNVFSEFYLMMCNGVMFVDKTSWDNNMAGKPKGDTDKVSTHFLGIMTPDLYVGFKTVTIMGANFTESMAYQLWSMMGYNFIQNERITKALRFQNHDNIGNRLTVSYMQNLNTSKWNSNKEFDGCKISTMHKEIAEKLFNDQTFLYVTNNDDTDSFKDNDNVVRIPVISHGMNAYQTHTNIFFSPSLNRKPKHLHMLGILGLSNDVIARATIVEICYQAIMRTALRDPSSTSKINVLVIDKRTAEGISVHFNGCSVISLANDNKYEVKGKTPLTKTEKNSKAIHQKYVKELMKFFNENNGLHDGVQKSGQKTIRYSECPENDPSISSSPKPLMVLSNCSRQNLTMFMNRYTPSGIIVDDVTDTMSLVSTLKTIHTQNIRRGDEKEDMLWSPSLFKDNQRSDENLIGTSTIVIDIDGGDVTKDAMKALFKDYSFVIMNTHSTSIDEPNRYRILFFVDHDVNADEYSVIVKWIESKINTIAYTNPKTPVADMPFCKFDRVSQKASQVYYFPCKVVGRPDHVFFEKNKLNKSSRIKYITVKDYYNPSMNTIEKPELVAVNRRVGSGKSLHSIMEGVITKGKVDNKTWVAIIMALKAVGVCEVDCRYVTKMVSDNDTTRLKNKKWAALWKQTPKMDEKTARGFLTSFSKSGGQ